MSLIERAVKRMDEAPAKPFRPEPQVGFEASKPMEAVAVEDYLEPPPRRPQLAAPVAPAVASVAPVAKAAVPVDFPVEADLAEDDWVLPKLAAEPGRAPPVHS